MRTEKENRLWRLRMAKAEGFPLEPAQRCRDGSVAAAIENVLGAGGLWVKTFVLTSALEPAM